MTSSDPPTSLPQLISSDPFALNPITLAMMPDPQNLESTPIEGFPNQPDQVERPTTEAPTQLEPPTLIIETDELEEADDMPTIVLPLQLASLDHAAKTDVGRQREHNEDYFGIVSEAFYVEKPSGRSVQARALYVLCDGMGGHAGGEVASQLAVDTLQSFFQDHWDSLDTESLATVKLPPSNLIREGIIQANGAIFDRNQAENRMGSGRMGTTLVMILLCNTAIAIAHVGDSRLYRYTRKRGLEQLTIDHEVGQREIQRGVDPELAYARPDAYQLTQALGPRDEEFIEPDIQFMELNEDTLFILASDGLTDNQLLEAYTPDYIEPLLSSQASLDQGVRQLIDLANEQNGHDNITALVIRAKVRPNLDRAR